MTTDFVSRETNQRKTFPFVYICAELHLFITIKSRINATIVCHGHFPNSFKRTFIMILVKIKPSDNLLNILKYILILLRLFWFGWGFLNVCRVTWTDVSRQKYCTVVLKICNTVQPYVKRDPTFPQYLYAQ